MGVDLDTILKTGSRSRQATFQKFYSKELEYMDKDNRVAETIVKSFKFCNDIYDTSINNHYKKYSSLLSNFKYH